jgi:protein phosphatase
MTIHAFGVTDKGRVRPHNEDALLVAPDAGVFAVADGMGGHAAGEVASRIAIEAVDELLAHENKLPDDVPARLKRIIQEANRRIAERIQKHPECAGMGTTLVLAAMSASTVWLAHVGDSRAYLLRNGTIRQLTSDHSFVNELVRLGMLTREQASRDPRRNVVTRALGSDPAVAPDVIEEPCEPGDVLLLCSDGLNTMLPDDRILQAVADGGDLEAACRRLVADANESGGEDNITVVLVRPEVRAERAAEPDDSGQTSESGAAASREGDPPAP